MAIKLLPWKWHTNIRKFLSKSHQGLETVPPSWKRHINPTKALLNYVFLLLDMADKRYEHCQFTTKAAPLWKCHINPRKALSNYVLGCRRVEEYAPVVTPQGSLTRTHGGLHHPHGLPMGGRIYYQPAKPSPGSPAPVRQ